MKIPEHAQADVTAVTAEQLKSVTRMVDSIHGEGYAKKNPGLVAALVQTAAYNFRTHIQSGVYDE